jgi:hypothetical protein
MDRWADKVANRLSMETEDYLRRLYTNKNDIYNKYRDG